MLPSDPAGSEDLDPLHAADENDDETAKPSTDASTPRLKVDPSPISDHEKEPSSSVVESGSASESSPNQENAEGEGASRDLPPILTEIRRLQIRIRDLKAQAVQQYDSGFQSPGLENPLSKGQDSPKEAGDDSELPRRIGKAPSARQWTRKMEKRALNTADERKQYGQGFNDVPREQVVKGQRDFPTHGDGGRFPTMYHIQEDGTLFEGDQFEAIYGHGDWYRTHQPVPYYVWNEVEQRHAHRPYPHRGFRPPSALRPRQEKTGDSSKAPRPSKSTTKLGPPTRWDTSDSEGWSSDTSTRSQDFRYFRSRLRGDFEWELDRLNAQMEKFNKHRSKQQARLAALRTREEHDRLKEAYLAHGMQGSVEDHLSLKSDGRDGRLKLNPVGWELFRVARRAPKEFASVIDVLTEEPQIDTDPWMKFFSPKASQLDTVKLNSIQVIKAAAINKAEVEEDTGKSSTQPVQWTGRGLLPERIRINSRSIIECLSSIHGSAICEDSAQSVVVLRPFRILNAYDREIRDIASKRIEDTIAGNTINLARIDEITQTVPSDSTPSSQMTSQVGASGVLSSTVDAAESSSGQDTTGDSKEREVKRGHMICLQSFMDEYLAKKIAYLASPICTKIVFSDLWYLFQPGTTVISADGKQAFQVVNFKSKPHKGTDSWTQWSSSRLPEPSLPGPGDEEKQDIHDININCVYIQFDGRAIGPAIKTFGINKWDGEKDISLLDLYPLRFYILKGITEKSATSNIESTPSEEDIDRGVQDLRQRLITRGKLFKTVAAVKQMYYSGLAVDTRDEIESQVMIDFEAALSDEIRRHWVPTIRRLVGTDWDTEDVKADKGCNAECCRDESVHDDYYVERRNTQNFINTMMARIDDTPHKLPSAIIFPRSLDDAKTEGNDFTDDEFMIMSYSVFGFVLRDRTWAELDLDYLSDVATSGTTAEQADDDLDENSRGAFGQLVLPSGHKKMVLSLISQHFRNKGSPETNEDQVDIVRGKGKGLIILLHGAPGVGKTTTAEGVAETFGKPLFQITCGDLGSNPKEVESALQTNFALANRWGCILLLDEADVFLAERRREDFNRNGMVAVFLRVLEYYAGILFLTTNRIGDFDEAFASRIHMSLYYPALDELSTMKVFRLNLDMIKSRLKERIKIDEDEIVSAAMKHWREHPNARWNGRQIRNACQTALALAENDAQPKGQKYNIKAKTTAKVHLTLGHLEIVSDSYLEFTDYLRAVHGADAEGRAKESGLRALETLLEALKSDKGKTNENDGNRSSDRSQRRPAGSNSPLQSFTLRPTSSVHQPSTAAPSTPEPRTAQPTPQSNWGPPQWSQEQPGFQAQGIQHSQQGPYPENSPFYDPRTGPPTTQPGSSGRHLHAPQTSGYGSPMYGQYPPSTYQSQGSQPYGAPYPDATPPHGHGGPSTQGAGAGPRFHTSGDQSGQTQRRGSSPFPETDHR